VASDALIEEVFSLLSLLVYFTADDFVLAALFPLV